MMTIEGFLLGVIVTTSLIASLFFMKFWRQTKDLLFLAFSVAFLLEGLNRVGFLFIATPNEGGAANYVLRLVAFLIILAGIVYKRA